MNYKEAMNELKGMGAKTTDGVIIDLTNPLKKEYRKNLYFYQGSDFVLVSNEYVDQTYYYENSPYQARLENVISACAFMFAKRCKQ